jgi:hypothetical protein
MNNIKFGANATQFSWRKISDGANEKEGDGTEAFC